MKEEKEIKVEILGKNKDFGTIVSKIENQFNVKFGSFKEEVDTYYDNDNLLYFKHNHVLRLRNNPSENSIAYKALFYIPERKENPWFVLEKESEFPLSKTFIEELTDISRINLSQKEFLNSEEINSELLNLGFKEKMVLRKYRKKAKIDNSKEITLDYVKNLGVFIELEEKESRGEGLHKILERMPFEYKEERFGYTNLYAERVLGVEIPDFKKLYERNPEWNFFQGQREKINKMIK